jgi:hypothetical protein
MFVELGFQAFQEVVILSTFPIESNEKIDLRRVDALIKL